ncbi:hypothetical protein SPRG_22162 [Saprolegnia parasitica CBS 223.65]|uniref:Uncharacterized protein n=1 Tax=Saprolegnia parasitica (strain CBS 223.65) TaxID=695850 RepID=A0A067CRX0_SAPPC|nr:hypothetical protein SPRG_22162 [Saprolegnia parasitica CBS 223.65]KDO29256.1 hypothetical protein SPRG_22162 [Saprolegnia parasitica CBS 223.65]|eukprot:XP_012200156.1 hypothetical protein SPRG_22162 [Saprolegnia parasitica CBS 223.65]
MKKESQSMFAKRTRPPNAPHSLGDVPLFVPTEHLEDEAVKTHDPGAVEAWVNAHLLRGAIQLIPLSGSYVADDASHDAKKQALLYQSKLEYNDIQTIFSPPEKSPLEGAGIDSGSLLRLGMPKAIVDRIFRGLFVYSSGFHTLIHEIGRHCPAYAESHIAANIWLTFLHLLEKCEDGRYEMAMLKFNHATAVWKQNAIREYELQTSTLQAAIVAAHAETHAERAIVAERVAEVTSRDATIAALQAELQAAHEATAASDDLVRLANLEILELENTVAATRKELADTSQSLHVALAEKSNLQGELTGYIHELQNVDDFKAKVDEQKTRAADRMRELQAANQAIMDELDLAKRDIKAGSIERLKHHAAREVLALSNIKLEAKVASLSAELHTAVTALAAKTSALDEADATVLSLKQVMEKDRGACASLTADVAALTLQIGQQKRDYMVLEAQAQLLLMEKKNNHMREGDRLRIERLLNKKVELEKDIESMRIEREKSQEHLWNVRASLESVENELQLAKRAFATSQTSLQQLDKVNDQLRSQIAEMERNVERMTIGFNAMRDRCTVVEDGAKASVDKVELELKVAMSQMREMAYTRRENECQIHDLAKTIEANHMEVKILHQRLEQQDKIIRNMTVERDALVREKRVLQLESNASQLVMSQLNKSTTGLMDRIRKHEVTFDEAIVELKGHYEHAFAFGHGHLEASLGSGDGQHVSLPSKSAADVMHKSVVAVMALMDMRHENPAFSTTKRRHSLKGHELKVQCEYRIVELGQEIARREAERVELLRLVAQRDEHLLEEKQRTQVEIGRRNMHAERSLLVLEDFAARLLRFRAYEQATTRKIMDQEFELYQYKHRVANLRDRVAMLKLMLDQSGMAEEDASGYLTIEKIRFITRVDEAIQAVEDMADGSTQTYPPKRSPIKERAKLHGMDFSGPESVLTNITSLIPDEELDHHFFSLTHHGRDATTEYAQGHLLRRSIMKTKGAVLPKLTQASLEKAPHRAPFVRTNVIADYETQFGLHARIAMGGVGPFAVSRPVSNPEDSSSELGDDFGPFASFTREISEHDYSSPHLTSPRAKNMTATRVVGGGGRLQSVPKKSPVPPPMRPAQRHPKAHGVRRARPTRHDMSQIINVPSDTVEYDVAVLDALRTQQPVYRHVDGNGLQYHLDNATLQDDDDDDDDGGNRLDDYFTTNDDGMLVARVETQPNAHVPTLLEQRIKAHHQASTSEGPHAGWDLRGNNHVLQLHGESTPLPPVLYPLTKS